jgi:hypothetical protein
MKWNWDFIRNRRTEIPNTPLPAGLKVVNGHPAGLSRRSGSRLLARGGAGVGRKIGADT